jgi:hypothetical protein
VGRQSAGSCSGVREASVGSGTASRSPRPVIVPAPPSPPNPPPAPRTHRRARSPSPRLLRGTVAAPKDWTVGSRSGESCRCWASARIRGDDDATNTVPDCGTPIHREDHCRAAPRNRAEGTSSHKGRMGEGPLRRRESAIGLGRDRRTAHPDRAAGPRARQQRRDRLRPLGSRRALRSTAGGSRPGRDGGVALLRTHPSRATETT